MCVDGGNPAFPRAIPHGTVIIDLLTKGVFFGLFPGCLWAVSRGDFQSPSEDISRGVSESILSALSGVLEHELEPFLEFDLEREHFMSSNAN